MESGMETETRELSCSNLWHITQALRLGLALLDLASNLLVLDNKWVLIGCLTSPISTVNANPYPTSNFTCRKSFKFLSVSFRSLVLSPDAYRSCSIFLLSKYTPNTNIRLSFPLVYNGSLRK